jgi:hypothetical protein
MIDELSDYTKGRLDIYKEVVEMLEDVLKWKWKLNVWFVTLQTLTNVIAINVSYV